MTENWLGSCLTLFGGLEKAALSLYEQDDVVV